MCLNYNLLSHLQEIYYVCVLRSAFCVLLASFGLLVTSSSRASAQALPLMVEWKWDAMSPKAIETAAGSKVFTITAKGKVTYNGSIDIQKVEFVVYKGKFGTSGYELVPAFTHLATLGAAVAVPGSVTHDSKTAVADPLKKAGVVYNAFPGERYKIVPRITYKVDANTPVDTIDCEPGYIILGDGIFIPEG